MAQVEEGEKEKKGTSPYDRKGVGWLPYHILNGDIYFIYRRRTQASGLVEVGISGLSFALCHWCGRV
jgi:hypothetical protein